MEHLKQKRKCLGIRQEDVAHALGISRATYINIEKGKRDIRLAELNILENRFGITLSKEKPIADKIINELTDPDTGLLDIGKHDHERLREVINKHI